MNAGEIQIDVWAGEHHQSLVREYFVKNWHEAASIIEREVEAGMLCNVLHTDFKSAPLSSLEGDKPDE